MNEIKSVHKYNFRGSFQQAFEAIASTHGNIAESKKEMVAVEQQIYSYLKITGFDA